MLSDGLGVATLGKCNEVAVRIEDAELTGTPRLVFDRCVRMHDT